MGKFKVPKGMKVASPDEVLGELEVLLPHHTVFVIEKVEMIQMPPILASDKTLIDVLKVTVRAVP